MEETDLTMVVVVVATDTSSMKMLQFIKKERLNLKEEAITTIPNMAPKKIATQSVEVVVVVTVEPDVPTTMSKRVVQSLSKPTIGVVAVADVLTIMPTKNIKNTITNIPAISSH